MTETQNDVQAPDISDEEMKMPETQPNEPVATTQRSDTPLHGGIILILILLLLFILGGLYVWFSQLMLPENTPTIQPVTEIERPTAEENNEPESETAEAAVETQTALSTSDEIAAIEADLEATDLDSLDAELNAIDAELEAGLNEL